LRFSNGLPFQKNRLLALFWSVYGNAALTIRQRQELQRLRREAGWTITRLATHCQINRSTVFRWVQRSSPEDGSAAPITHERRSVTAAYQEAVIAYRHAHPTHGPQRLAEAVHFHLDGDPLPPALTSVDYVNVEFNIGTDGLVREPM